MIDVLRPLAVLCVGAVVLAGLFLFRLDSLVPGVSPVEAPTVSQIQARSLGAREILDNPLYLPHQIGQYVLEKTGFTDVAWVRGIGAVFGIVAVLSMFYIVKHWHTPKVAWISIILIGTSSWLLHSARLATPETTYLLLPLLILIGIRLQQGDHPFIMLALATLTGGLLLYVPGMVWFILPGALWQRKRIFDQMADVSNVWNVLLPIGFIILLMPLAYALSINNGLIITWLGVSSDIGSFSEFLKSIINVPIHIIVRSDANPVLTIGRLPYLDIATTALAALGGYWYTQNRKLDRTKFVFGGLAISTLIVGISGGKSIALVLPFVYLLAAAGITLLLQQWFTVFPRNPLARGLGIGMVSVVIMVTGFYHLQRYFVAWPNTPATKQTFSQQ